MQMCAPHLKKIIKATEMKSLIETSSIITRELLTFYMAAPQIDFSIQCLCYINLTLNTRLLA